jgi:predicted SAM-dependent methyltransferase
MGKFRMNLKNLFKSLAYNYASEHVVSEVAVTTRMVFLTRLPNLLIPWRRAQLKRAKKWTDLKVNIGCGPFLEPGWVGLDYRSTKVMKATICCDIKKGLPFSSESCRFIFSEHVFEHFDLRELSQILQECYRVLKPGGVLRIIMPDLRRYALAYSGEDHAFEQILGTGHTGAKLLNELFYHVTHRFIHDYSSIESELAKAGFSGITKSSFRSSAHPELNIDCDFPWRIADSLYVEACKI